MKHKWFWIAGVAAVLLAAAAVWMVRRPPPVEALTLREFPLVRTLQFSAKVATLSRVDVGSTLTGRVAQVLVAQGAQVRKGQLLVQMEQDELQAAVAQALASERQAQARVAGLLSTGRTSAQAALSQADATLKAAQAELERTQQLVAQGFVSESRLDDARRTVEVARAQQQAARAQVQANADAGTDLVQAQAQLASASAQSQSARARLAQAAIVAPSDALVLSRQVEVGQIVQPGRALMSLALAGPTQLVAQVDERFLDQLKTGQKAAVVADAFASQRFAARVLSISPAVDAQRGAVEVRFALEQQAPAFLREDMTLSVEVETARRDRTLVMPLGALRSVPTNDASAKVLVAVDGHAQERGVRLGLRTLDAVEVLEGLANGDVVLLGGDLRSGHRVRTQPSSWQPGSAAPGGTKQDVGSALTNAMGR